MEHKYTSVVVMVDKTSWLQALLTEATSESNEFFGGISRFLKSQAVSLEMNDIPIFDSTMSWVVILVAGLNETTAPSLFFPETLELAPKEASFSPSTPIPENVRTCDGAEEKEPQKKIFQSAPSNEGVLIYKSKAENVNISEGKQIT